MFTFLANIVPSLRERDIERAHRTPAGPPPHPGPDARGQIKLKARPIFVLRVVPHKGKSS